MNATKRLQLTAPLQMQDCGKGLWCLRAAAPAGLAVYLRGCTPPAALADCTEACVQWSAAGGARLSAQGPAGPLELHAACAFAHSSCAGLYAALPLARFDARMARFWRRVFVLVRLPGAPALLRWVAAKSR